MGYEQKIQNLEHWAHAFPETVREIMPQIRSALSGKVKLPESCPSKGSLAEMLFRRVKKGFDEIESAIKGIEKTIWEK